MPPWRIPVVSGGAWLPQRLGTNPTHHAEVAIHRVGTEGVATHPEKLHTPWQKLETECASAILIFTHPVKFLNFPVSITFHPFHSHTSAGSS